MTLKVSVPLVYCWLAAIGIALPANGCAKSSNLAQPAVVRDEDLEKGVEDPELALAKHTYRVFSRASAEELSRFLADPNCGVALFAAWEQLLRTVTSQELTAPNPVALSRFLGFVEGRLHVSLPPMWQEGVQTVEAQDREGMLFSIRELDQALYGERPWPKRAAAVECDGTHWTVILGKEKWVVPLQCDSTSAPMFKAGVCLMENRAYVALYGSHPRGSYLYAIDRAKREVEWSRVLWGGGGVLLISGVGWHEVEFRVRGDCLFVFGISGDVAYIEGFETRTGKNLWRFGTGYLEKRWE